MIRAALLLALLGGCQVILGLDQVGAGSGSGTCGPQAHDEDGDGVPDCMDVCPGIAGDQADSDHDGVGDMCDPQPGKQDMLVKFYAFDNPDDLAQFTPMGGHWFVQDDALVNDETTSNMEDQLIEGTTRDLPIAIEAGVTVDTVEPTPPMGIDSLIALEYTTTTGNEYSCNIRKATNAADTAQDWVQAYAVGSTAEQPLANPMFRARNEYQIREVLTPDSLSCVVAGAAGDGGSVTEPTVKLPLSESVGVYTQNTGVHFQYLAIYALGN